MVEVIGRLGYFDRMNRSLFLRSVLFSGAREGVDAIVEDDVRVDALSSNRIDLVGAVGLARGSEWWPCEVVVRRDRADSVGAEVTYLFFSRWYSADRASFSC